MLTDIMKISFKYNEYHEHDDSWEELVVSINYGPWIGTIANYGSEDEDEVKLMIVDEHYNWQSEPE